MDSKIQELTDKIYKEGVEKGNAEADRIVAEAKAQESQIVAAAQKEAARIVAEAQKSAEEMKQNTQAELKLFAAQSVEALKTEITNLLTEKLATEAVESATSGKTFMQDVILAIVKEWAQREELTVATADEKALRSYFEKNAKELLKKGVKIEEVNGLKAAFEISPASGAYKVTFGDEEFISYFKEFLRPQLVKMLF